MSAARYGYPCILRSERGIALPVVLMALVLLAGLTSAFLAMAGMEPLIAINQRAGAQALALAEAGIEHTLWALSVGELEPGTPGGLVTPLPDPAPAPFDGSTVLRLGPGGYSIRVIPGTGREVRVRVTGYVVRPGIEPPTTPAAITDLNRLAQRSLEATLVWIGPPATRGALTTGGSVELRGNAILEGDGPRTPGGTSPGSGSACSSDRRAGVAIRDRARFPGPDGVLGTADDEVVDNTVSASDGAQIRGVPAQQVVPESEFDRQVPFSPAQLDFLRERARARGTYLRPGGQSPVVLTTADGSLREGLVFVDTVGGVPVDRVVADPSVLPTVRIVGPARARGWLVVLGQLELDGEVTYEGLIYAATDLRFQGSGSSRIRGGVVSASLGTRVPTVIDLQAPGSLTIAHDCTSLAAGGGAFDPPRGYFLKPGSWREVSH